MLTHELEVINLILRRLGEPPISSIDTQYPTLDLIRPALDSARIAVLQEGWWFNTVERYGAVPGPDGTVNVPADTLAFYPADNRYCWVGNTVTLDDGNPVVGETVYGRRVFDRDLYTIPHAARYAVAYLAALRVYSEDIGVDSVHADLLTTYGAAYMELSAQHTRHRALSSLNKPHVMRWRRHLRS